MKSKKEIQTCSRLVFFVFCFVFFISIFVNLSCVYGKEGAYPSILTDSEKAWLKAHPIIKLAPDPEFKPIEFFDEKDVYSGMAADYAQLLEQKLGIKFKIIQCANWDDVIKRIKSREVDVLNAVVKTPQRETYLRFPPPYLKIPSVIIVRKSVNNHLTLDMLKGMKIVMISGYGYVDLIRNKYPELNIELVPELKTALRKVSFGMADAFVGDLATTSFYIESEGITNLKLAGETDPPNISGFAVRSDWPKLSDILEKGMAMVTKSEKSDIYKKWINLTIEPGITMQEFKRYALILASIIVCILAAFLIWNRQLKHVVNLRTEDLRKEIEEHQRTERYLEESKSRYRSLLEAQTELFCRFKADGEFTFVNHVYCDFFNKSENELIGKKWQTLFVKEDVNIIQEKLRTLSPSNHTIIIENRVHSGKGKIHWMQFINKGLFDNSENLMEIQSVGRDITERKKAESALLENNELLTSFIRHSPIYCYIKKVSPKRSVVLQASENFDDMIGIKGDQMIGKAMDELFPPEFAAKITADDWKVVSQGDLFKIDEDLNGRNFTTLKFPIVLESKTFLAGYTIDITERNQAEAEKLMAQKIADEHGKQALIGQIAGKMAHDFNNILGIIMGNTELALIDCPDAQTKKRLDLIYNQTIRGKNLTKNLVVFAKDQEPKQEFFSIDEKIDLVLNLLKKDIDGINVIRQYSHGIPELLADSGMIEHAIVNLVQNSIHAVSLVEQPEIIIRIYHQDEFIVFEIEDNGCGIPSEFLGEIYEPSFTLKGSKDKNGMYKPGIKGTGYGMSNVKKCIEQHKGAISIHSEPKKGTNVIIKLPIIKKELTDEEIKDVKKEKIYFEKYILLVEDEQAISDIQYSILTHDPCNHKVDVANNGQMAIDLLKRNQYDLISLDYVLPGGGNGMDVYHRIREMNTTIPILFISGNIEFLESIKDLKQKDPYIDHLSKPCKNIDYINCVNRLFGSVAI